VLLRFFQTDEAEVLRLESGILRTWSKIRERLNQSGELLDLPDDAAAYEAMLEHVVWNTDFGPSNRGHLPQADAMARLAIRLEHFLEVQNGDSLQLAKAWAARRTSLAVPDEEEEEFAQSRCMVTCADALLETGSYEAALLIYSAVLDSATGTDKLGRSHVLINQTMAFYQLGRNQEALTSFETIDAKTLEDLAGLILIIKAEWARYLAGRYILNRAGGDDLEQTNNLINEAIHDVAIMVGSADGRTGYLRGLFVGQISRDIAAILALNRYSPA
jgi:tetratricopeptide (TPR) repeat protein